MAAVKKSTTKAPRARVIRSLVLSREADAKIVRAARVSGESVLAFIRTSAEIRAERVMQGQAA